ncbi:thiamine-phosphate kinase [Flammeovirga kamogawensis]|uniref:Thiamine-monophosphate kinase n=1 Tax=Flammeovirga kamogawensis TaxID=373891 RepID=A0ABX8GX45_9BACT|nr:thiamine-phosphate kinase [Flammeovirga kamogawensis]MBB6460545.1 thiamine-monophosphate kinase [Flammeovirga kamogawensis]QWG07907.1 thiamine-phosphate kinase [Flammeovirga kamogawensis]TRX69713.1 thiamine-phosphate kinase [Flammeovirga kamogawensis]
MSENNKRTEIGDLGEFGLIDRLTKDLKIKHKTTAKGVGDDAAVFDYGGDEYTVLSTDILLEGIHFDLSFMPLQHLGYKAIAVNVSDIAAMNAIPEQVTVSIAVTNRFSVEAIEMIYEGIKAACENYNVDLVGGDTTSSRQGLCISVTAVGRVKKDKIAYRSGAKKGDILCVTGDLGGAYMGLQVLLREKAVFEANPKMQPNLDNYQYVAGRQLRPEARTDVIHELNELGVVPTSMIDVSDGVASEVLHICKASNVGAVVYEDKLPIDQDTFDVAHEFKIASKTPALNGGEDYELLFTIKQEDFPKLEKNANVYFIGYIDEAENGARLFTEGEQTLPLTAQGWKHF